MTGMIQSTRPLVRGLCGAAILAVAVPLPAADPAVGRPSQQEVMAGLGLVRHDGAWRTPQEIALVEAAERERLARREWTGRLERLRRRLDQPHSEAVATEEIRGITDPAAVPALVAALGRERVPRVRDWYLEALARIRAADAHAAIVAVAVEHPDHETRIAAVERIVAIGPHAAVPALVATLRDADNARVNRAAEALGRLGLEAAVEPLINALVTQHVAIQGDGTPEGSTTATFTPDSGGLSMGGGTKRVAVPVKNDRVLEALVGLTNANFEWDVSAWRAWLAGRRAAPPGYDPRRG